MSIGNVRTIIAYIELSLNRLVVPYRLKYGAKAGHCAVRRYRFVVG